jgi:CubicO group peptidase (beta-lactamase class C family)
MMKRISFEHLFAFLSLMVPSAIVGFAQTPGLAPPDRAAIEHLDKDIPKYMGLARVPGASAALIRDGKLVWLKSLGVTNGDTRQPVTDQTIFEANSLSKPVFALAVLTLVDQGRVNLDAPVIDYDGTDFKGCNDLRFNKITTRMILSHSSGIIEDEKSPCKIGLAFNPGERFQYSPAGFDVLSDVVEKISGMKIEDFIKNAVLAPLAMNDSSYVWRSAYDDLRAYRHDWAAQVVPDRRKWTHGAACCSLQTNARDYAKYVVATLNGSLIKKSTREEMLKPQIAVSPKLPDLHWGLGWGLETTDKGESIWHWGDSGQSRNYVAVNLAQKNAVILFTNSENGLSFLREILDDGIGGNHQAPLFLDYERYDSPTWKLLSDVLKKGAAPALADYHKQKLKDKDGISETSMNQLGYRLLSIKKTSDAIAVLRQNAEDFPQSGNAWDSLAEACMDNGDTAAAIKYYQKSLDINPKNDNAKKMMEKLRH